MVGVEGTTVVFVVDTSITMANVLLKLKDSIWNFVHKRANKLNNNTKFLLVTYGDSENCVKAGWDTKYGEFLNAVQELEINHLPNLGGALANAVRLLRSRPGEMVSRNYGRGWLPFRQQSTVIICFTSAQNSVIKKSGGGFDVIPDIVFPKRSFPGENLDSEWWNWSTRFFIGRVKFPGMGKTQGIKQASIDKIHSNCHSDSITVWNTLSSPTQIDKWLRCIWKDFCMKRVLLAEFSDVSNPVNPASWTVHRDMFIVPPRPKNTPGEKYSGVWPFPEGFPVNPKLSSLGPRKPFPLIRLQKAKEHEMINLPSDPNLGRFPIDTYEVFSAKRFGFITEKPDTRYVMYIFDSVRERQYGKPFGYMFFDSKKEKLFMVLGPYDYPWLFQHLQSFVDNSSKGWSAGVSLLNWRSAMEAYLWNIPPYYVEITLSELAKLELGAFLPKIKRPSLSASVTNHLQEVETFWRKQTHFKTTKPQPQTPFKRPISQSSNKMDSFRTRSLKILEELRETVCDEINGCLRSPKKRKSSNSDPQDFQDHELPISLMGNMQFYRLKKNRLQPSVQEFRDPFNFSEKSKKLTVFGGNPYRKTRRKSAYPQVQHAHKKPKPNTPTPESPKTSSLRERPAKRMKTAPHSLVFETPKIAVDSKSTPDIQQLFPGLAKDK